MTCDHDCKVHIVMLHEIASFSVLCCFGFISEVMVLINPRSELLKLLQTQIEVCER